MSTGTECSGGDSAVSRSISINVIINLGNIASLGHAVFLGATNLVVRPILEGGGYASVCVGIKGPLMTMGSDQRVYRATLRSGTGTESGTTRIEPVKGSLVAGSVTVSGLRKSCVVDPSPPTPSNSKSKSKSKLKVAILTPYRRRCGVAMFASDLRTALLAENHVDIVMVSRPGDAVLDTKRIRPSEVKYVIRDSVLADYRDAVSVIDSAGYDIVLIQHEYGLYGGFQGAYLLEFATRLRTPYVLVAHTVLMPPPLVQWSILSRLASGALFVANINPNGCAMFGSTYNIAHDRCHFIPHGVRDVPYTRNPDIAKSADALGPGLGLTGRKVVLSFGLLGPGKGLEDAIVAMKSVRESVPDALLVILGQQHPDVAGNYVKELMDLAESHGLVAAGKVSVELRNFFPSNRDLELYLAACDVFLTNYPNKDQVSSGTLTFALAAGALCVSTPYAYAVSVLGEMRGVLVDAGIASEMEGGSDVDQLALVLIKTLNASSTHFRDEIRCRGYHWSRRLLWKNVARQYTSLIRESLRVGKGDDIDPIPMSLVSFVANELDRNEIQSWVDTTELAWRLLVRWSLEIDDDDMLLILKNRFLESAFELKSNRHSRVSDVWSLKNGRSAQSVITRRPAHNRSHGQGDASAVMDTDVDSTAVSVENARITVAADLEHGQYRIYETGKEYHAISLRSGNLRLSLRMKFAEVSGGRGRGDYLHEHEWRLMEGASAVSVSVGDSGCQQMAMEQPLNVSVDGADLGAVVVVQMKATVCPDCSYVTVSYDIHGIENRKIREVSIGDVRITSVVDHMPLSGAGWAFDRYQYSESNARVPQRSDPDLSVDGGMLYQSRTSSPDHRSHPRRLHWEALSSTQHSGAILIDFNVSAPPSTTKPASAMEAEAPAVERVSWWPLSGSGGVKSLGHSYHAMVKKPIVLRNMEILHVATERYAIIGRCWPSRMDLLHSSVFGCADTDTSVGEQRQALIDHSMPSNVGLVAKAVAVVLDSTWGLERIFSQLSTIDARHTTLVEIVDAIDALASSMQPESGSASMRRFVNLLLEFQFEFGSDQLSFACSLPPPAHIPASESDRPRQVHEPRPNLVCHLAAMSALLQAASVFGAPGLDERAAGALGGGIKMLVTANGNEDTPVVWYWTMKICNQYGIAQKFSATSFYPADVVYLDKYCVKKRSQVKLRMGTRAATVRRDGFEDFESAVYSLWTWRMANNAESTLFTTHE